MSDNVLQTLQQLIQDVIAPDVRELKVRVSSLEQKMDIRFDAMDVRFAALEQKMDLRFAAVDEKFNALEQKMDLRFAAIEQKFAAMEQRQDAQFRAILAAIGESRAQTELSNFREFAALSERVAVLEAKRQ